MSSLRCLLLPLIGLSFSAVATAAAPDNQIQEDDAEWDEDPPEEDSEDNPETDDTQPPAEAPQTQWSVVEQPPDINTSEALVAPPINTEQHEWLEPARQKLPQNPYGQTDFTAYTLEWGELKVGVGNITFGAIPHVQIGTSTILNAIGVYNGTVKINALRLGPTDVALGGSRYTLNLDDFSSSYSQAGAMFSFIAAPSWSIHAGAYYTYIQGAGLPDLTLLSPFLTNSSEGELERYTEEARARDIALDLKASAITTRFATDYRFNRRDSIVFQFQAMIWNDVLTDIKNAEEIPPILQFEEAFAKDQSGVVPIGDSFVTGLAYQAAWNHLEIRVGAGYSAIPFAWLLQSMELSWRFGGTTRSTERRMRRTWGRNRADIED